MNYCENYHFGGMHLVWWLIWLSLLIWFFIKKVWFTNNKTEKRHPIEILNERLAIGEINDKEYLEKKSLIKG